MKTTTTSTTRPRAPTCRRPTLPTTTTTTRTAMRTAEARGLGRSERGGRRRRRRHAAAPARTAASAEQRPHGPARPSRTQFLRLAASAAEKGVRRRNWQTPGAARPPPPTRLTGQGLFAPVAAFLRVLPRIARACPPMPPVTPPVTPGCRLLPPLVQAPPNGRTPMSAACSQKAKAAHNKTPRPSTSTVGPLRPGG